MKRLTNMEIRAVRGVLSDLKGTSLSARALDDLRRYRDILLEIENSIKITIEEPAFRVDCPHCVFVLNRVRQALADDG